MTQHGSDLSPPPDRAAPPRREPLIVADHLALDFANSLATPDGVTFDWIDDVAGLERWLAAAQVGAGVCLSRGDGASLVRRARELRGWLRSFLASRAANPTTMLKQSDLDPLNAFLADTPVHRRIEATGSAAKWTESVADALPLAPLFPVAHAIGDLLCDVDPSRVRQCEGEGCTLWFLDRTKAGKRRWCSMAICGNRAKARAHRRRSSRGSAN